MFLAGVLLVDGLDLWAKDAHLRLRHIALVGEGPEEELDEERHQEDDDPPVRQEAREEGHYRDDQILVEPAEDTHTEVDQMVKMQGIRLVYTSIIALQEVVVIRPEEEHKRYDRLCLLDRDRERPLEVAGAYIATPLFFGMECELIVLEARSGGDEYRAEVLILEGDPTQGFLHVFVRLLSRL